MTEIARFTGAARALPLTFLTLGLGGLSLMGLPPSGGFERQMADAARLGRLRPMDLVRARARRRPAGGAAMSIASSRRRSATARSR